MSIKEHDCGSDRIAEAVSDMDVDIIVNVQGDEPFTDRKVWQVSWMFFTDVHNRKSIWPHLWSGLMIGMK